MRKVFQPALLCRFGAVTAFSAQNLSIFWVYKAFFTRYNIQRVENMQGAPLRPGTVPVMRPGTGLRTMGIEFNRIITLLRKERGITQKQAAQDLGISQAQLSHYEKGIRECGLAFVVQVADYYDVSCDYLLGRSAERSGQTITVEELPEGNSATGGSVYRGSVLPTMYKKLIENSLDILYDKLQESRDKQLVVGVSSYLMLAVYKMFRLLYEASPKNVSGMFRIGSARWDRSADAAMSMAEGDLAAALTGEDGTRDSLEPATLALSTDQLARDYPRHATSLFNLVKNAEEAMRGLKKAE